MMNELPGGIFHPQNDMKDLLILLSLIFVSVADATTPTKPNILFIVADDMGFSDAGCYGGEIQTPNLDRLWADGLRFTQFYNTARCWSSRACILTGYYAQAVRRDKATCGRCAIHRLGDS